MNTGGAKEFCINCRQIVDYQQKKEKRSKIVKGKKYVYEMYVPYCKNCGEEIILPQMMDKENEIFDKVYRKEEKLVSKKDIEKLMTLYDIGKGPLSLALGFGEITITRYLLGQMPSKDYSDIISKALTSPTYMIEKLNENKEKISYTAYEKAKSKAIEFNNSISGISEKMIFTISYIFKKTDDITPLTLQKLLFFSQGINLAINNKNLFNDDCEAWAHGPVFPPIYRLFRDFKYSAIDDSKFCFFSLAEDGLDVEEKEVIKRVVNTFGRYSGKILEEITHNEEPWKNTRIGLEPAERGNQTIDKKLIKDYFDLLNERYTFSNEEGINNYINEELMN